VDPLNGPSLRKVPAAKPLLTVLRSIHCCELPGDGRQVNVTLARVLEQDAVGWLREAAAAVVETPAIEPRPKSVSAVTKCSSFIVPAE
jgi:hypothetical protein